ncbi:ABC transporter ATP-binding protein [Idiomarina sp. HP20-50]|uniref:ABC transporter ATP-binding protein n=1 Tax=Idiomarina sp. HP20-50 TaxID=3070813 RepID=UPI00294B5D3D|nr:ABC transporter ATP-binding protein [Idiomarina sp. HP20-50]MDV6316266.1 ABC transporter ATP-binding protein [Idiomarina sp. HP20-50]
MSNTLKLLVLLKPYWRSYSLAILALSVGTMSFLFVPPQIGKLVGAIGEITKGTISNEIWFTILSVAGLLILQAICSAFHAFLVSNASEKITNDLRVSFFSSIVGRRLHTAQREPSGQIASEFASDLVMIQAGLADNLINFLRNALFSVAAFIALLFISPKITVVTLGGVFIIFLVIMTFVKMANKSILAVQKHRAKTVSLLLEASNNNYIIQAYQRVDYMNERFANTINLSFEKVKRHLLLMASISPISLIVFSLVMALSLAYGAGQVSQANITLEEFITYITYAVIMVASVSQVGLLFGKLKQAATLYIKHEERFNCEVSTKELLDRKRGEEENSSSLLGVKLENVSFSYFNQDKPAVDHISFVTQPGEITALVGKSGAGKSTLAALIGGLFNPSSGQVTFYSESSHSIPSFPPKPEQVAIVPQEPFLMSGSFLENITFGRRDISYEQAKSAAKLARIDAYIESQPEGYNTCIEESGANLSRGQKQRIALARALVLNPKILLLDEATASVDVITEKAIRNMIEELEGMMTVVIIAHQGQLLSVADNVVVLEQGSIVFDGKAEEFRKQLHQDSFSREFKEAAYI